MTNMTGEMTLAEMYRDPLILSVMRADGVALSEFKDMMFKAAASLKTRGGAAPDVKLHTIAASSKTTNIPTMQPFFAGSFQPCCANL